MKRKSSQIIRFIFWAFFVYFTLSITSIKKQINEKANQLEELNTSISSQMVSNDEIGDSISNGVTDEYIAGIARDKLGYVLPGERVFVDTSSK